MPILIMQEGIPDGAAPPRMVMKSALILQCLEMEALYRKMK